jgi:hypothetical protein
MTDDPCVRPTLSDGSPIWLRRPGVGHGLGPVNHAGRPLWEDGQGAECTAVPTARVVRGVNETVITGLACGHVKASKCAEVCACRFEKLKRFSERRPNLRELASVFRARFFGDAHRKWIEADVIAGPSLDTEGLPATTGAACASTQLVA